MFDNPTTVKMSASRQENKEFVLVLIGYVGSGKSSTGNTISGNKIFGTGAGTSQKTVTNQTHVFNRNDVTLTLIDTPGFRTTSDFNKIIDSLKLTHQQNTIYALVISIGRFTPEERELFPKLLLKIKRMRGKVFIIFSRESELEDSEMRIETWLEDTPTLKGLISSYKLWYIAFENKETSHNKEAKVQQLFTKLPAIMICHGEDRSAEKNAASNRQVVVSEETMKLEFGRKGEEFFQELFDDQNN